MPLCQAWRRIPAWLLSRLEMMSLNGTCHVRSAPAATCSDASDDEHQSRVALPLSSSNRNSTCEPLNFGCTRCARERRSISTSPPCFPAIDNFPSFGVEAHVRWTAKEDPSPRAIVPVSYAEGDDPGEVVQRYIQSPDAANDARGFDAADILGVEPRSRSRQQARQSG